MVHPNIVVKKSGSENSLRFDFRRKKRGRSAVLLLNVSFTSQTDLLIVILSDVQNLCIAFLEFQTPPHYINQDSSSNQSFETIFKWIEIYQTQHHECAESKQVILPARLLDVRPHSDNVECRLVEPGEQKGSYLALSHC
jgi:hypothetical protein